MLQGEHSAILLTCIKQPFVIKILGLFIFEWMLKTGFTVIKLQWLMCHGMLVPEKTVLNTRLPGRVFRHFLRDLLSFDAMKQISVIIILPFYHIIWKMLVKH